MRHAIQRAIATLRGSEWMPMTARVSIGIFFCISGGSKLLVPAKFSTMEVTMTQSHIRFRTPARSSSRWSSSSAAVAWRLGCSRPCVR